MSMTSTPGTTRHRLGVAGTRLAAFAVAITASSLILAGCATSPLDTSERQVSATGPAHVLEDSGRIGDAVIWGGQIVDIRNRAGATELIVSSRPLERGDRPRLRADGGVRFVAVHPGFLEPVNFAPGRFVTVLGTVDGVQDRPVDEFSYRHPVLRVEQVHLWPANPAEWQSRTRFSIGVGVRL